MINFKLNRHTDKDNKDQIFHYKNSLKLITNEVNLLTPKISLVILLTVCHTVLVMLVWRI